MRRWTRSKLYRPMTAAMTAAALVSIACTVEDSLDEMDQKSGDGAVGAVESPANTSESLPRVDERGDAAGRAHIEALTREASTILVRAADFLAGQRRFRVLADISFDVLQSDGQILEFGGIHEITMRRPDRLRIKVARRDGQARVLYFDGATISIDLPGHRAFVREEWPGTAYAALDYLSEKLGVPTPLEDLVSENFATAVQDRIESGYYVGPVELAGRTCDQLAFRLTDVDAQLWVEQGIRPLICRIVITHKHSDGNPQFRATLHDWDLTPETPEGLFQFEPEEGSEKLVVSSINASPSRTGEEID